MGRSDQRDRDTTSAQKRGPGNNSIRVISGKFRGRKLQSPGLNTHPMGAREKLALFNMVEVTGQAVLDLYAGSGALGIEALSLGAEKAVFVEKSRPAATTIATNLRQLGISENPGGAEIFCESVQNFSHRTEFRRAFSVIFADPPYDDFQPDQLREIPQLLAAQGTFALSSPSTQPAPQLAGLEISSSRTYAGARITLYHNAN